MFNWDSHRVYWSLAGLAVFLLIPVDMVTTVLAAHQYGVHAEANPLVRWSLQQGLLVFSVVNLIAGVLAIGAFGLLLRTMKNSTGIEFWITARMYELWVSSLIIIGIVVAVNNLLVVFTGTGLITV